MDPRQPAVLTLPAKEEFVVLGRSRHKKSYRGDGVLVRSEGASLELIGFARSSLSEGAPRSSGRSLLSHLLIPGGNEFNFVESDRVPASEIGPDRRSSFYVLAWSGTVSQSDQVRIHEAFKANISDILRAYEEYDHIALEWSISEVMYEISRARHRTLLRRRQMRLILALYSIMAIAAIVVLTIRLTTL
jgi:hypothetical protein